MIAELGLPGLPEALPRAVVDSHTHLDATQDYSGLSVAQSLRLAAGVGVTHIVQIGCDVASSKWALDTANEYDNVVATVALHPNEAARLVAQQGYEALDVAISKIAELAGRAGVRAIGETGLDYFRTETAAGQAAQAHSFLAHIELAVRHRRTLVIHNRDAGDDVLAILDAAPAPERVIMHCFAGDADFALECVARDAWLSFPGVLTYKNAPDLRSALQVTPLEKLLVETDAPYLTPTPHRGKANAPYLLAHTVRFMAAELGVDVAELCDQLRDNTWDAYGGAWGQHG